MEKKIVVVGAGYSGILAAKKLAKKFKKMRDVSVTIIDKNPFHTMLTELHEVAANRVEQDSIKVSLKRVFAERRVEVITDTVLSVDFDKKQISGKNGVYPYDILVMAAGAKPCFFGVPGAEEFTFKLWSYKDAVVLKQHIHKMFHLAACETDIGEKKRLLTFYVVGAGFTGVEMAGELAEYVPILCDQYEIEHDLVSIHEVDILDRVVPMLPEKLSCKVERRLKKMGVQVRMSTKVINIGSDFIETEKDGVNKRQSVGTIIWAAGTECTDITQNAAQSLSSEGRGRIRTDAYLRSIDNPDVFVIGDNVFYIPEGEERPVPQMVENCEQSSAVCAKNIFCAVTGKGEMVRYEPTFHGVMVSIGGRYGVAHVGFPNAMVSLPSFLAMFVKHFINVIYFIQLLGWNKVHSYIRHEFFTVRNLRSFLGGHFSNRTPSFLLFPLRVWLGLVWIFEGVMKVVEGWLLTPKLTGFFGGASDWYNSILHSAANGASSAADAVTSATTAAASAVPDAVTSATTAVASAVPDAVSSATTAVASAVPDAISSATAAVASAVPDAVSSATTAAASAADAAHSAGTVLFNIDWGWLQAIFVSGKDLPHSTLSDYAFKLNLSAMNSFIDMNVLASNHAQLGMQTFIVLAEIILGILLTIGFLTTPAAALSLILQLMFVCTTGLYLGTFWMVFAGIACLLCAGRVFGVDYYFMPYLSRKWKKIPLVRKLYLYND
jgi:NADH dehydrogenase